MRKFLQKTVRPGKLLFFIFKGRSDSWEEGLRCGVQFRLRIQNWFSQDFSSKLSKFILLISLLILKKFSIYFFKFSGHSADCLLGIQEPEKELKPTV